MKLPPAAAEADYPIKGTAEAYCGNLFITAYMFDKKKVTSELVKIAGASWDTKKTNIEDLCAKAGISKGAFYLFYASKEELFLML